MALLARAPLTAAPASRVRANVTPRLGSVALRPSVRVQFKDDSKESMQERAAKEEVIRRQEELLAEQIQKQMSSGPSVIPSGVAQSDKKTPYPYGFKISPLSIAFTKRRELIAGRLAMVGFFATCFAECVFPAHPNAITQVAGYGQLLGFPIDPSQVALFLGALVVHNFVLSLAPGSPTWSPENQADVASRPQGPPLTWFNPITDYKRFFGVTSWGFTKENELFHGRLAMLGFAGSLIQTLRLGGYFGPGPLAQLASFLGSPADDAFYAGVPGAFLAFSTFAIALAFINGRFGQQTDNSVF